MRNYSSATPIQIPLPLHRQLEQTSLRLAMLMKSTKPTRAWFLAKGYKQADTRYTNGYPVWLHPHTNDVLLQSGEKLQLQVTPDEKYRANSTRYLKLGSWYGNMYLARLKYLTFVGPIKEGEVIDHIDGNTMNNDIDNLRAVPKAINFRDGGFMRKLRNDGIIVAMFPTDIILAGYERMAKWKETHKYWQYRCLRGAELRQVFFGPNYKVVDPTIAAGEEPDKYI